METGNEEPTIANKLVNQCRCNGRKEKKKKKLIIEIDLESIGKKEKIKLFFYPIDSID